MTDPKDMPPAELRAFMTSPGAWGQRGSVADHALYVKPIRRPGGRRKCHCGCKKRVTHMVFANGLAMMSGCELSAARWAKRMNDLHRCG